MTDDKLARWLWDFVESFFAEADSRKPVAWEDFLHMPGVDVGWWRGKAAEVRALLQEDAKPVAIQYREYPQAHYPHGGVYPIKDGEVVVRWQDHPHGGGYIVEMNVAGNIAQTGLTGLLAASLAGKRAAERLGYLHPPSRERDHLAEKATRDPLPGEIDAHFVRAHAEAREREAIVEAVAAYLEKPYPTTMFGPVSDDEYESVDGNLRSRMHAAWARHWAKVVRESADAILGTEDGDE